MQNSSDALTRTLPDIPEVEHFSCWVHDLHSSTRTANALLGVAIVAYRDATKRRDFDLMEQVLEVLSIAHSAIEISDLQALQMEEAQTAALYPSASHSED